MIPHLRSFPSFIGSQYCIEFHTPVAEEEPQPEQRVTRVRTTDPTYRVGGQKRWREGLRAERPAHKVAAWSCDPCRSGFTSRVDYIKHLPTKKHQDNLNK